MDLQEGGFATERRHLKTRIVRLGWNGTHTDAYTKCGDFVII